MHQHTSIIEISQNSRNIDPICIFLIWLFPFVLAIYLLLQRSLSQLSENEINTQNIIASVIKYGQKN